MTNRLFGHIRGLVSGEGWNTDCAGSVPSSDHYTQNGLLLFLMTHRKFHTQLLTLKGFLKRGVRYSAPVTQKEIQSFSTCTNPSPSVVLISSPDPSSLRLTLKKKSVFLVLLIKRSVCGDRTDVLRGGSEIKPPLMNTTICVQSLD